MKRIFSLGRYLLPAAFALAGCSSLPKYVPPPATTHPATIANYPNRVLCKLSGVPGPDGLRACQARVLMIDGAVVPTVAQVSVLPGKRRISLFCHTVDYAYRSRSDATPRQPDKAYAQKYDVVFPTHAHYTVEPFWEGGICRVRLVDDAGQALPMKDVLAPPAA
jgi:hypothetical protein